MEEDYTKVINLCDNIRESINKANLNNIVDTLEYIIEKIRNIESICCSDK